MVWVSISYDVFILSLGFARAKYLQHVISWIKLVQTTSLFWWEEWVFQFVLQLGSSFDFSRLNHWLIIFLLYWTCRLDLIVVFLHGRVRELTVNLHIECGSSLLLVLSIILSAVDSLALNLLQVFLDTAATHTAILELLKKSLLVFGSNGWHPIVFSVLLLLLSREMLLLLGLGESSAGSRCTAYETLRAIESIGENGRPFFVVVIGGCSSYSVLMPAMDNLAGVKYRPIISSLIVRVSSFRVKVSKSLVDGASRCAWFIVSQKAIVSLALCSIEGAIVHGLIR